MAVNQQHLSGGYCCSSDFAKSQLRIFLSCVLLSEQDVIGYCVNEFQRWQVWLLWSIPCAFAAVSGKAPEWPESSWCCQHCNRSNWPTKNHPRYLHFTRIQRTNTYFKSFAYHFYLTIWYTRNDWTFPIHECLPILTDRPVVRFAAGFQLLIFLCVQLMDV